MGRWLVALALLAGCSAEPAWQEGEIGVLSSGLTVGGAGGCSTFILDGLSRQLIGEQNCIRKDALVSFAGKKNIAVGSSVYAYLEPKAAGGLEAAALTTKLSVNSAFRTVAQQYLLYHWYETGQCGISLAAVPGNSNHETGIAVDLANYSAALGAMQAHGWSHSYPSSDPVHYDYVAGGTVDLRSESVLAFQRLWNLNHAGDPIAEDGDYGPQTEARLKASPATGFAAGSTCATPPPPATTPPALAAELVNTSLPQTLAPGESAAAWVELKNTGTTTWTAGLTHLGTANPHDRPSALAGPDWLGPDRPTGVDADTAPGEVGRFSFFVHAPDVSDGTALSEDFELVQEGVAWFGAPATVTIELEVTPGASAGSGASADLPADGAPPAQSLHAGGCSMAGPGGGPGGSTAGFTLLLLAGLTLCTRRRASYLKSRWSDSAASSSSSASR